MLAGLPCAEKTDKAKGKGDGQMLTLADKGGRGGGCRKMLIMSDKGGRGVKTPPLLDDIICEQPLKLSTVRRSALKLS